MSGSTIDQAARRAEASRTAGGVEPTKEEHAAAAAVLQMIWGIHISRAVYVVAKLGIADLLAGGPMTAAQLAQATQAHEGSLYRMLRLLASLGVLTEHDHRAFSLTVLGERLRADVPASMRSWAMLVETVGGIRAWEPIIETVRRLCDDPRAAAPQKENEGARRLGGDTVCVDQDNQFRNWRMARVDDLVLIDQAADETAPRSINCYLVELEEIDASSQLAEDGKKYKVDPDRLLYALRWLTLRRAARPRSHACA